MTTSRNALTPGHQIHWYVISSVLGQGGFGITYLAEDSNLGRTVAIKEYLPTGMAVREGDASVHPVTGEMGEQYQWGLDRFISEAQTLARFKHPNIVQVYSVFSEHNTAYMVMEFEQGQSLDHILKDRITLPESEIMDIISPLLDGLEQVHAVGFIHRDIKPANIFIRENGSPVLLDFGSARQSLGEHTQTLTAMVSPGFAPFEQYSSKGDKQGPWTDIYGLGSTLYRAVMGRSPPNAMDRSESLLQAARDSYVSANDINPDGYSLALLTAIDAAMQFKPQDRPQTISTWREILSGESLNNSTIKKEIPIVQTKTIPTKTVSAVENTHYQGTQPLTGKPEYSYAWRAVGITLILLVGILFTARYINRNTPNVNNPTTVNQSTLQQDEIDEFINLEISELNMDEFTEDTQEDTTSTINASVAIPDPTRSATSPQQASINETPVTPQYTEPSLTRDVSVDTPQQQVTDNPANSETDKNPRAAINRFENRIREAIQNKNYAEAERYLQAMQKLAPNNQRIKQYLERVRSLKHQ